jgi:hypothetical protein
MENIHPGKNGKASRTSGIRTAPTAAVELAAEKAKGPSHSMPVTSAYKGKGKSAESFVESVSIAPPPKRRKSTTDASATPTVKGPPSRKPKVSRLSDFRCHGCGQQDVPLLRGGRA